MRLILNEPETPTTRRIRLSVDGAPFAYQAGQAASLAAADAKAAPYSIASAPSDTARHGWLEFLVKVDGSTRFGAQVAGLDPDTDVEVSEAKGSFVLSDVAPDDPLIFIAGGTGIAPLRAMIREARHRRHAGPLALVYSARAPQEFAYLRELREMADAGALKLTLTLTGDASDWPHARGRANVHLEEHVTPATTAFLCGPDAMVAELSDALKGLGVSPANVRSEGW